MSNASATAKTSQLPSASFADDDMSSLLRFDGPPTQPRPVGASMKKMLQAIRQQPSIYDPEHELYGDAENRERVWSQLAKDLQMPDVRAHWNNCFIAAPRSGRMYIRDEQRRHLLWMFPFLQKDFERKQSNGKLTESRSSNGEPKTDQTNGSEDARREDVKRVVAAVEKHPCLYNPEHSDFGDEKCQSEAWKTISEDVDIPEPEALWKSIFRRKKGAIVVDDRELGGESGNLFPWLAPFADAVGRPIFRATALKVIDAVRKVPALYDPAHPRYAEKRFSKNLWAELKDAINIEHAKALWLEMLDGLMEGKTEADGLWCAQEMEWVRPYMKDMVKASYCVYVPANSVGSEEVKSTNDGPKAKRSRIAGGPEAELTCMLGCMADMLRDTPAEKRWELFDKFREFSMELSSNGET